MLFVFLDYFIIVIINGDYNNGTIYRGAFENGKKMELDKFLILLKIFGKIKNLKMIFLLIIKKEVINNFFKVNSIFLFMI